MAWTRKLPSGRWCGQYRDTYGKVRSVGTFTHKAEAAREANAKEAEVRRSLVRNADAHKQTWGEWSATWWPTRNVEAGTLKRDRSRLDVHLMPKWGSVPLGQITRHDVKAWAAELRRKDVGNASAQRRKGLSNATVQRIVHLLSASLAAAVDAEILASNPAARIKLPPAPPTKDRYLEHEEYDAIVEQLPTTTDQLVLHTLTYAGLRFGELSGLRWQRVDLAKGQLVVAEVYDDEVSEFKPYPKGRRARAVPLDRWLVDLLGEHKATSKGRPRDLVFTSAKGAVLRRSNWDNVFRAAVAAADLGIEDVTLHTCRHTFCSWLAQEGVSLARIGQLAGHESPLTTQRYSHLQPVDDDEVFSALGRPKAATATRLLHAVPDDASTEANTARSNGVGPVGIEPTTRGLKGQIEPCSPSEPEGI